MKTKKAVVVVCITATILCMGCGEKKVKEVPFPQEGDMTSVTEINSTENNSAEIDDSDIDVTDNSSSTALDQAVDNASQSIQDEIAMVEERSAELENTVSNASAQDEMNLVSKQWFELWDTELNALWSRLSTELDADAKEKVLNEQRDWIKRKDENVIGAGAEGFGGSIQPLLENTVAAEMTRARAYSLAGYLADVRGEAFFVSPEIQRSIEEADLSLDEVFQTFEGKWMFDQDRNACIGVQRTADCLYGVEGSNWTVWITGGDLLSDLDVYGYSQNAILFKSRNADGETIYMMSLNFEGKLLMEYGKALGEMEDTIVCEK